LRNEEEERLYRLGRTHANEDLPLATTENLEYILQDHDAMMRDLMVINKKCGIKADTNDPYAEGYADVCRERLKGRST